MPMRTDHSRLEALLSRAYGVPAKILRTERIEPWYVVRCHLTGSPIGLPKSVIVKSLREHPSGFRTDPQQVFTEKAALDFLDELGLGLAPRVLASDLEKGILVLEDLAPRIPLAEILRGGDSEPGRVGLEAFARSLGQLHAGTVGLAHQYHERRRTLGPVDEQIERQRFMGWGWTYTRRYVEGIGVVLSDEAEKEMASVMATLDEPGAFLAFSNGDAATNNFLVDGNDGRLIDFEFAGFRHALTDIVCFYVPGPMWITVGDPVKSGLESVYREALLSGVSEASDDREFGSAITIACLAFAVERLNRLPKVDGRGPGDDSRIQLISTLESAARVAQHHRSFPHLRSWTTRVAAELRRRWEDADVDLGSYPSYVPRG